MIEFYTDGSCLNNGKENSFGGYGVVLVVNEEKRWVYKKGLSSTTNNRAELLGVIHAIALAKKIVEKQPQQIKIHTDSAYVQQMATRWMWNWEKKGWKKGDGKEPENLDLVKTLFSLLQFERTIKIEKIKGHAGHKFNELADDLATSAAEEMKNEKTV